MDIREIKKVEMQEIIKFYYLLEEHGDIVPNNLDLNKLDEPFKKILEGISDVKRIIDDGLENSI